MRGWTAAIVGVLAGAGLVVGLEVLAVKKVARQIQVRSNTSDGYKISLYYLPAVTGMNEVMGVTLTKQGNPVPNVPVTITVMKADGQNVTWTQQTDNNGVFVADFTVFHNQAIAVTASYTPMGGTPIADSAHMVVSSEPCG